MFKNPFSDSELSRRVAAVRAEMDRRSLDLIVLAQPESIFYLTGLDHWGYFVPTYLIVPADDEMVLVTREVEWITIGNQLRNARFVSHTDSESAPFGLAREMAQIDLAGKKLGFEVDTLGMSYGAGQEIFERIDAGDWVDISGMVDHMRWVKSPEEMELTRQAAKISDIGMQAAIAAIHDGAREVDVVAECDAAMIRAGGNPPGFGPFIRPEARINEPHTAWGDGTYKAGERVMLELSGCVSRYHAPLGRLVHLGSIRDEDAEMAEIVAKASEAVLGALKEGTTAGEVFQASQDVLNSVGMQDFWRHHCGYIVGIGFPPAWTGGNKVTGLRPGSDLVIREGMTFHQLNWFFDTGRGDFFASNCIMLGPDGAERLTHTPIGPTVL
jgi:Xaa-Pro dipeptidase